MWVLSRVMLAFLGLLVAGAIGGCSSVDRAPAAAHEEPFAAPEAYNMFKVGFSAIVERYIDPVSAEEIALAGLGGLAVIDPALSVGKARDEVQVDRSGRLILSLPTPKARDVDGWARTTVQVWRGARDYSARLAATPQEDVYEAVFDAAVKVLGPHARYATPAEARRTRLRRDGYLGIGVGIVLNDDQEPEVREVVGRGPAERAGLRVGDVLVQVDGRPVAGLSVPEVEGVLGESVDGRVRLTVRRLRATLRFVVTRRYLIPETVSKRYQDGILYLAVSRFNQGTADELASTLEQFSTPPAGSLRGVVLDLRGNPGGLLQQAVKVADLFLLDGPVLATRGRHPDSSQDYLAGADDVAHGVPLVILVDHDTASAAEMAAAALQDRGRAVVVGSSSYGKGTVQTVIPLPNGGDLGFTWSRVIVPSGIDLRGRGVHPLVCTSGLYVADPQTIDRLVSEAERGAGEENAACPAERREGPVDVEVARRLFDQPAGFAALFGRESVVAQVPAGATP